MGWGWKLKGVGKCWLKFNWVKKNQWQGRSGQVGDAGQDSRKEPIPNPNKIIPILSPRLFVKMMIRGAVHYFYHQLVGFVDKEKESRRLTGESCVFHLLWGRAAKVGKGKKGVTASFSFHNNNLEEEIPNEFHMLTKTIPCGVLIWF